MAMFKTILTAVDFSEISREVLHYAVRLAGTSPGAKLVIAHVVSDPFREPWMVQTIGANFNQLQQDFISQAKWELDNLMEVEGVSKSTAEPVVVMGRPADAIVELASQRSADLLVIGTHGYGALKHLMLGSVAERVLRHAPCPVLTVPSKSVVMLAQQREQGASTSA